MGSNHTLNLMWQQACEMLERAERMERQFFRLGQVGRTPAWVPPVDIYEDELEVLIQIALPGIEQDEFQIQLEGTILRLQGNRRLPQQTAQYMIRRLEIPYGHIERSIVLPPGRWRLGAHTYLNGFLDIRVLRIVEHE